MSCGRFDFNLPWVLAQWQPPLRRKLPMPHLAAPRDMQLAQTALYSLAERSTTDMYIPDGVLPTALHRFLTEIGATPSTTSNCLLRLLSSQLQAVVHGTQALMLRTTALWQNLGSPMCGFGRADRLLQPCEACGRTCSHFFVIRSEDSPTSRDLVQRVQQAYLHQLSLNNNNRVRTQTLLAKTVELNGVSVCLPCAGPSLGAVHRQQHLAVVPEQTSLRGRVLKPVQLPPPIRFEDSAEYRTWVSDGVLKTIRVISGESSETPLLARQRPGLAASLRSVWQGPHSDLRGKYFRRLSAIQPSLRRGQVVKILGSLPNGVSSFRGGERATIEACQDGDYRLDAKRDNGTPEWILGNCDLALIQCVHPETDWIVFDIAPSREDAATVALVLDTALVVPASSNLREYCVELELKAVAQAVQQYGQDAHMPVPLR